MAKNKIAIISICSILLLAMVVAVTISATKNAHAYSSPDRNVRTSTSTKAIKDICRPTDYKETCERSLSSEAGDTSDLKELVMVAFKVTENEIRNAIKNSTTLQKTAKDPSTADAFKVCKEVLGDAIDDLYRSFERFNVSDISKWDEYAFDLRIWLSGTVACQETCLDSFQNTTGETGQNMKQLLKKSRELTVNALSMIEEISKAFSALTGSSRRLLNYVQEPPQSSNQNPICKILGRFCLPTYNEDPGDPNVSRRKLLSNETLSEDPVSERRKLLSDQDSSEDAIYSTHRLLLSTPINLKPDLIVAQDGSGKYKTINEALKDIPLKSAKPFVIYIKAGTYKECVHIDKKMTNVVFIGDGPTKTKITGNKSVIHHGLKTFHTATVGVDGFGFMARDIGFENTAGHTGHQAVALRVSSDQSVFYNCQIDGYQDTLYAHDHRQFYRDCTISGTVDFIFGDAAAVFQNCKIIIRKPGDNQACMVTAQGRKVHYEPTGFVLQNCNITAEPDYLAATTQIKSYLGRPWKNFAKTIILNSQIESVIQPQGWEPWPPNLFIDTCSYTEYGNTGPAADLTKRVKWPGIKHVTTRADAEQFTPGKFLRGDDWIPATGVPYDSGMITAA